MRGCKKKAGHLGSLFFVKKKTPAQSLRECFITNEKKHASNKPAAKVLQFCELTKF